MVLLLLVLVILQYHARSLFYILLHQNTHNSQMILSKIRQKSILNSILSLINIYNTQCYTNNQQIINSAQGKTRQDMSEQDSCYSNDQQYFMDLCRGNQFEELKEFIEGLPQNSQFNWGWFNTSGDNFIHMIAANNYPHIFEYLLPVITKRCPREQLLEIINKQNSTLSTPLHYAVVTDSTEMVKKLLEVGANPQIKNQQNRTPLEQAEKFNKFSIAELLAPVTKTDIEALKKQLGDVKLNDDDSDDQPNNNNNNGKQLEQIQQKNQQSQQVQVYNCEGQTVKIESSNNNKTQKQTKENENEKKEIKQEQHKNMMKVEQ